MKTRNTWAIVCAMAMMVANVAQAADGTWTLNNAGNWSTTNNWSGGTVADGADFTATLGDVITADRAITLDSVRAIGGITVLDTSHNYTITSSKLTLDVTAGNPTLTVPSGRTLTISSVIAGSDGLTKTGVGTLTVSGNPNQFTGNTVISNGKVALGAQYALWQSAYDTTGSTGTIGLDRSAQATPWLGGLAGSVDLATAITGYSAITSLTLNPQTDSSVSYGGVIANGAANMTLNKSGHGTQTLTSVNTYSGATTVWAGTLGLGGASGSALNSAFTVKGGTLLLDNSGGTWANRLTDGTAISLGSLTLKSYNGAGAQTETVGATTFAVSGKVTVDMGGGSDQTTLAMGTVTRSAGTAIDFVGVGGTLGGGANSPNVTCSGAFPNISNGILGWATVGSTQWGENNAGSVRAYSGTFVDPTSYATDATKNAQLTGSGTMNAVKSFNSLNVIANAASQSFDLSTAGVLTLNTAGGILKSGTDAYTISGTAANALTAGAELIAHVDGGALTISAKLNTAILGLAKGGTGDLILSGTRAGTMSGSISIAGGQLEFQGNSTTLSGVITGAGGLTVNLSSGQTLTMGNNANSYAGPTIVKGGYLANSGWNSIGLPGGNYKTSLMGTNLKLEGGIYLPAYTFDKDLGAGPNQVQILGGTSGFVHVANSGGATGFVLDGGRELVWGSTYFNPTVFVFSTVNGANITVTLASGFDLNGSTRTIMVGDATYNGGATGGISALSGAIRTSSGTAGLTKTGPGLLQLSGASTFNDAVTVSQGTLECSWIANVASANPLGQSSAAAANLVLANGTTLKYTGGAASSDRSFTINGTAAGHSATLNASGSGALVLTASGSPAYGTVDQTRTLILTGTAAANLTNTLAATLADNGTGALSVNKTGAGTWVLTGASSYTGPTTISGGLLGVGAANNLGASSGNLVFDGGGLQVNGTSLTKLSDLGRTVVFTAGKTVTFNIADASNTFTVDQDLTGVTGVTVTGAGKVLFNPPYTGPITIVSGTTLQYNDGPAISTAPLLNNGTLIVNRSGTDTQSTTFHSIMGGTGSLTKSNTGTLVLNNINIFTGTTKATAGTLSLSHPMALMNSAVDTAGLAGAITLSGVDSPIFGGLTGTVAVATALTGYGSVTNLTLNPQSGITYSYSGSIADGATGMILTKTGAGTQTLTGNNIYNGVTYLNGGVLALGTGSTIGKLSGSTGLTFNGGTLQLAVANNADNDSIPNAATITANISSTFGVTAANAGGTLANEIIGAVTLNAGQMSFNWTNGGSSGTLMTLTSLSRSGTASANFNSGFAANNSRWKVTGAGTTTAGQIIGPWYTTGGNNAGFASTDYAVYSSDFVAQAAIAASAETTWLTAANAYTLGAATTLTGTRTITALRYTGAAATFALGANSLETYGLLNGGSGLLTVSGTGALTTPTGGGSLFLTAGSNGITVSAPINNNSGNVTLVKNGSGTLTLSSTTSTYSGGTVVNAGNLSVSATANLSSGDLTFNGSASVLCSNGGLNGAWPITLNNGAIAKFSPASGWDYQFYTTGAITGNGGVYSHAGGSSGAGILKLSSTANTFTGPIYIGTASLNGIVIVNSLADSDSPIQFGYSNAQNGFRIGCNLVYHTGAITDLVLNRRYFVVSAASPVNGANAILNDSGKALTINTDLLVTATGSTTLTLGGTGAGLSTFAGKITDGPGAVVSLSKAEGGKWVLSGANTFSGATTVNANGGTLVLAGSQCLSDTAALSIFTTGSPKVQLNTGVKERVGSLIIASATKSNGKWGRIGNPDADIGCTDAVFTGDGLLYVGIDPPPPPPQGTLIQIF